MKKIILTTALLGVTTLFSGELNIADEKNLDDVTMCGLNKHIAEIDNSSMGLFYLHHKYSSLFYKVQNDEFELDETVEKYKKLFKAKLESSCDKVENKEFFLLLNAEFEKYNFSKKGFPIDGMKKGSYVSFSSPLAYEKVQFDNIDIDKNFLPMSKDKAKAYIKSKKRYGDVDRSITAKYYFTINTVETSTDSVVSATADSIDKIDGEIIHGKVTKVEFLDTKTKKVLGIQVYTEHKTIATSNDEMPAYMPTPFEQEAMERSVKIKKGILKLNEGTKEAKKLYEEAMHLKTKYGRHNVKKDVKLKITKLIKKACDGGNARACYESIFHLEDQSKTMKYLKKSCDGNFLDGCQEYIAMCMAHLK
jgi:hypothetical protein